MYLIWQVQAKIGGNMASYKGKWIFLDENAALL
jgi:hypothetical protein